MVVKRKTPVVASNEISLDEANHLADTLRQEQHAEFERRHRKHVPESPGTLSAWGHKILSFLVGLPRKTVAVILLWVVGWRLSCKAEFGLVYFISSCLIAIFTVGLSNSRKNDGSLSAYSVFNKDCVAMEGSLSSDQFERELRHQPRVNKVQSVRRGFEAADEAGEEADSKARVKRNDPCTCGSGLKYKKCCYLTKGKAPTQDDSDDGF